MADRRSNDRVRFIFTGYDKAKDANVQAAKKAFGMNTHEANVAFDRKQQIICRPSQFARFLIYRCNNENGDSVNFFKCLEAELFYPQAQAIDVSGNEANHLA